MTTSEYTPLLRSGNSRGSTAQHHTPIQSHYFDITDIESWPIAGLLVLLDGLGHPVRAELHLYDSLEPHVQEAAIRQARMVLRDRYVGSAPVPVRVLETFQVREEMSVVLAPVGARPMTVMPRLNLPAQWRRYAMIGGAILVLLILFWVGNALLGPMGNETPDETVADAPSAVGQVDGEGAADAPVQEVAATEGESAGTTSAPVSGGSLPVSRNARSDLGIGVRIQVVPGLRVALRSEPGIDRGIIVGELTDGDVATIVAGPENTQGDSDTIVWWFITLENGTQSWVAANTSQQTLLMPAQ